MSRLDAGTVALTPVPAASTFPVGMGVDGTGTTLANEVCRLSFTGAGSNYDTLVFSTSSPAPMATFGVQVVTWTGADVTVVNKTSVGDWTEAFAPALVDPLGVFSFRNLITFPSIYIGDNIRSFTSIPGAALTATAIVDAELGDVTAHVAELKDNTVVQHFLNTMVGMTSSQAITAVDPARSAVLTEVDSQLPYIISGGSATDEWGDISATADLTTPTNVDLEKENGGTSHYSGAVFQFGFEDPPVTGPRFGDIGKCCTFEVPSVGC